MAKYVSAKEMAFVMNLRKLMKYDSDKHAFVDCWRNRMIRKYVTKVYGSDPEILYKAIFEYELKGKNK